MKLVQRSVIAALAAVAGLALAPLAAQAQSRHGGGHGYAGHGYGGHGGYGYWGPGMFWGGVGLGIGLGSLYYYNGPAYYPGYVVAPAPVYVEPLPQQAAPAARALPEPVIYPRNGQSAAQTEADRQECNRWATTQPAAMADASVFNRATAACMDAHGYTLR